MHDEAAGESAWASPARRGDVVVVVVGERLAAFYSNTNDVDRFAVCALSSMHDLHVFPDLHSSVSSPSSKPSLTGV